MKLILPVVLLTLIAACDSSTSYIPEDMPNALPDVPTADNPDMQQPVQDNPQDMEGSVGEQLNPDADPVLPEPVPVEPPVVPDETPPFNPEIHDVPDVPTPVEPVPVEIIEPLVDPVTVPQVTTEVIHEQIWQVDCNVCLPVPTTETRITLFWEATPGHTYNLIVEGATLATDITSPHTLYSYQTGLLEQFDPAQLPSVEIEACTQACERVEVVL